MSYALRNPVDLFVLWTQSDIPSRSSNLGVLAGSQYLPPNGPISATLELVHEEQLAPD